ncbi:MAG: S8 family peptidase [Chitinophagales bacterium]|jgi:subtilisin family serine protease|nr:S8 family peptidase [Chitinophagales bacterium]
MKKTFFGFLLCILTLFYSLNIFSQNNHQIVIAFSPTTPQQYIDSVKSALHATEVGISYPSRSRLWESPLFDAANNSLHGIEEDHQNTGTAKTKIQSFGLNDTLFVGNNDYSTTTYNCYSICDYPTNQGTNIKIALVDTGIDTTHQGLSDARFWANTNEISNGIDDDANGFVDDTNGWNFVDDNPHNLDPNSHGTHLAGIMYQVFSQYQIANNVAIMNLKTQDSTGYGTLWNTIRAIDYANSNGAKVINLSLGTYYIMPAMNGIAHPLQYAIDIAASNQVLVVASAGNDMTNTDIVPHYPSSFNSANLLSVMSVDCNNNQSWFTNYGSNTTHIAAPGDNIKSTIPNNMYAYKSGTSMATAYITAIAALLYTYQNTFDAITVKDAILQTASFANLPNSSHGVVNPCGAIHYLINGANKQEQLQTIVMYSPNTTTLYNLNGQAIWQSSDLVTAEHLFEIQGLQNLPTGMYILHSQNNLTNQIQKIVKP